jgi:hypothetical protein
MSIIKSETKPKSPKISALSSTPGEAQRLDLMAVRQYPMQPAEAARIGETVRNRFDDLLKERLSSAESDELRSLMTPHKSDPYLSLVQKQILRKLDEVLIEAATTLGWRLYCCPLAMRRISYWCDKSVDGLSLIKRFHKAIELGVSVNLGKASYPINDPQWYRTKQSAVKELKHLLALCREVFRAKNRPPEASEVCNWFKETVERLSSAMPYWRQNLAALLTYIEHDPYLCGRIASGLVSRREAPSIFDSVFAYGSNVTESHARKKISELRSLK